MNWVVQWCVGVVASAVVLIAGVGFASSAETVEFGGLTDGNVTAIANSSAMDGVAGYVEGLARRTLARALSEEGRTWMVDAIATAAERHRSGASSAPFFGRVDVALKEAVKAEFAQRLRAWLPGQVRRLVVDELFARAVGEEVAREAEAIAERVVAELEISLNDQVDALASGFYDQALSRLEALARERGVPSWVQLTDLRETIRTGLSLDTFADYLAASTGALVGEGTVAALRARISDALEGNLPPEAMQALQAGPEAFERYVDEARQYFPGEALQNLRDSILNRPAIKLPTPAYAAMLAASAAAHFARAYMGMTVDPFELRRGMEVMRVMLWQVRNRQAINLSLMQLAALARDVAWVAGFAPEFDGILEELAEPFDRLQQQADRIDALLNEPLDEISAELERVTDEIGRELTDLQERIVGPMRERIDELARAMDRGADELADLVPDAFNGIPASWDELLDRAGLEGGLLGEDGNWRPIDEIGDEVQAVRDALHAANDAVSEEIAEIATEALDDLRVLGPVADIMEVEAEPALNPSVSEELDPVLTATGMYVNETVDLVIPGRGLNLSFARIYRGARPFLGEFGWGWTHSYAQHLRPWNDGTHDGLTHIDARGAKFFFRADGEGFVSPPGSDAQLVRVPGGFELRARDGLITRFDREGRLIETIDRHGNRLAFHYNDAGLLATIIDVFGRRIRIARRADGLIASLTDFADRTFRYAYNDRRELIGVTAPAVPGFPQGTTTAYRYTRVPENDPRAHLLTLIMDAKGEVYLQNRFDAQRRIVAQRYGGASWMHARYGPGQGMVASRTWITDAVGTTRLYEHDAAGHLTRLWWLDEGTYRLIRRYHYNGRGERTRDCLPSGRCRLFRYGHEIDRPVRIVDEPAGGGASRVTRIAYEPRFGRPHLMRNPEHVETRFVYAENAAADLMAIERRAQDEGKWQRLWTFAHDRFGQLTRQVDGAHVAIAYRYYPSADPDGDDLARDAFADASEAGGYLAAIDRGAGDERRFAYDPVGNITSINHPDGSVQQFQLDARNRIVREDRPGLASLRYRFDANDALVAVITEREGHELRWEFARDVLDRLTVQREQVAPEQMRERRLVYDGAGRMVRAIAPGGSVTVWQRDALGRVRGVVRGADSLERSERRVERDVDGAVIALIDGNGNSTRMQRNGFGEVIAVIDARGNRTEYARDKLGRIVERRDVDAKGVLLAHARAVYDKNGNLVRRSRLLWREDPARGRWVDEHYRYDGAGRLIASIDPTGAVERFEYDARGLLVARIDAAGVRRVFQRDASGRVTESCIDAEGKCLDRMRIAYSDAGFPRTVTVGEDLAWRYAYDDQGFLREAIAPGDRALRFAMDDLGRRVTVTRAGGEIKTTMRQRWGADDRLVQFIDAMGDATQFGYDALGRLIETILPDGARTRLAYDEEDHVVGAQMRDGSRLRQRFDEGGHLMRREIYRAESRAVSGMQQFTYDGLGRLTRAVDAGAIADPIAMARVHIRYDSLSRPVAEMQNDAWITRTFDDAGRMVALHSPTGPTVSYLRDQAGRLVSVMVGADRVASFTSDSRGAIARVQFSHGVEERFERDAIGHVQRATVAGAKPLLTRELAFGADGLLAQERIDDHVRRFERDGVGRLVGVTDESPGARQTWRYAYDAADNLIEGVSASNADVQRSDASGNLIADGSRRYVYDAFNRLTHVFEGEGEIAHHFYDAFDRRVRSVTSEGERRHLWNGWLRIADEGAETSAAHLFAEGASFPFATLDGDETRLLLRDRIGSRIATVQDGAIASRCRYAPYGEPLPDCEGTASFAGHDLDRRTGLVDMRERVYSPQHARFFTPDPLGIKTPHRARVSLAIVPALSLHAGQGGAARTTFPNRPMHISADYGVLPFGRLFARPQFDSRAPDANRYGYANADPSRFVDILGLAWILFQRSVERMWLMSEDYGPLGEYDVANNVTRPKADPLAIGANGPFPNGTYSIGVPDFINAQYRAQVYDRYGLREVIAGESRAGGAAWTSRREGAGVEEYAVSFGRVRLFAGELGTEADDAIAQRRALFLHGGRRDFRHPTFGCLRADDDQIESLAVSMIALDRLGDPVDTIHVVD